MTAGENPADKMEAGENSGLHDFSNVLIKESEVDRIIDKLSKNDVLPYVRVVDLNNGVDTQYENRPVPSVEAGILVRF